MNGFEDSFNRLIGNEGGYVNDLRDPGGETNWGISKRSYPDLDIQHLTRGDAHNIYFRDFWQAGQMDQLYPALAYQVFDLAVNGGITEAKKILQKAAGVTVDGIVGAATIAAVRSRDLNDMLMLFNAYKLQFYTTCVGWPIYGRGWSNRVATDLIYASQDN